MIKHLIFMIISIIAFVVGYAVIYALAGIFVTLNGSGMQEMYIMFLVLFAYLGVMASIILDKIKK